MQNWLLQDTLIYPFPLLNPVTKSKAACETYSELKEEDFYRNDVAIAPRDVIAAAEEGSDRIEKTRNFGIHSSVFRLSSRKQARKIFYLSENG